MDEAQSEPSTIALAGTVVGRVSVSAEIATSTGIWATWAAIAVRGEDTAHRARDELARAYPGGNWSEATTAELEASLVAISGAAFAIDGFYGSIRPWSGISEQRIRQWTQQRLGRSSQIFEVLKACFVLGSATNRWPKQLKWLFKLRDDNIHFDEDFRPPVLHPVLGNTTHERMTYAVENAEKAVDLMLDVITRLVDQPKPTADPQLIDFSQRWQANVRAVAARRDELKQLREQS